MMELRFSVMVDVPVKGRRRAMAKAAREVMLKLAAELIQCSVTLDGEEEPAPPPVKRRTTKAR